METNSKTFINLIEEYLHFCTARKNLDTKTIKSYSIDLKQYTVFYHTILLIGMTKKLLRNSLNLCIQSSSQRV